MSNKTSDKNVVNIENDVKIVHKIISFYKDLDTLYDNDKCKEIQALENILAEREQMLKAINTVEKEKGDWIKAYQEEKDSQFDLLKRIQELEEQVKMLDEAYTGTIKESKKWFDIAHNSIPKQVVIDEVKRLSDMPNKTTEGRIQKYTVNEIIIRSNTLQELLEGEK